MYNAAEIERKLRCGKLTAVIGTSALELGLDIGHVDMTLHLGMQIGGVTSLMQQMGRSGRRGQTSVSTPESESVAHAFSRCAPGGNHCSL